MKGRVWIGTSLQNAHHLAEETSRRPELNSRVNFSKFKNISKKSENGGMLTVPARTGMKKPRKKKYVLLSLPEFDAQRGDQLEIQSDGGNVRFFLIIMFQFLFTYTPMPFLHSTVFDKTYIWMTYRDDFWHKLKILFAFNGTVPFLTNISKITAKKA